MTTIDRTPPPHVPAAISASAHKSAANPDDLVGSGRGSARALGGIAGFGAGVGVAVGLTALTGRSALAPVRIAGVIGALGAVGGGAFLGQKLLGSMTRETYAESTRALAAKQADLQLEIRTLQADASGHLDKDEKSRVSELRTERIKLSESRPEANFLGKWLLPAVAGVGLMVASATIAGKLTPDDGKGINAMFNAMLAGGGGAILGGWAGIEAGKILTDSPHHAELPKDTAKRIDEIDQELGELLGASTT